MKWINGLHLAHDANHGVNCSKSYVVFFSNDEKKDANWRLPISNIFQEGIDACYFARINKYFGENFFKNPF